MKKHDRQLPGRGEVHRLQHRADVDRAVAEVGDREVGGAGVRCAQALPGRHRHPPPTIALVPSAPASSHCRCIEPPRPRQKPCASPRISASVRCSTVLQLRASTSAAGRRRPARRGASALARNWWWPRCEPLIASAERRPTIEPDRAALLADAGVRRTVDQALAGELEHGLLERADEVQLAEHRLPAAPGRRSSSPRRSCVSSIHWVRRTAGGCLFGIGHSVTRGSDARGPCSVIADQS